ncbi:hypothetical protein AeMF1_002980 [Aphanomyces euteiches]|nr:hypothetical protein AeMF1_002980 [Aphanomyces euteiches]KAH9183478.1 hypothetical protein AeNC1_014550 [Aphanomyces euteiches]
MISRTRRPCKLLSRARLPAHIHAVNHRASSSAAVHITSPQSNQTRSRIMMGLLSLGAGDVVRQLVHEDAPFDTRRLGLSAAIGGLYIPLRERLGGVVSNVVRNKGITGNIQRLGLQLGLVGPLTLTCFLSAHAVLSLKEGIASTWQERVQSKLAADLWPAYKNSTALSVLVLGAFYLPIPFVKELAVIASCMSWSSYMS